MKELFQDSQKYFGKLCPVFAWTVTYHSTTYNICMLTPQYATGEHGVCSLHIYTVYQQAKERINSECGTECQCWTERCTDEPILSLETDLSTSLSKEV